MPTVLHRLTSFIATAVVSIIMATLVRGVSRKQQFANPHLHAAVSDGTPAPARYTLQKSVLVVLVLAVALGVAAASTYERSRAEREANAATGGEGLRAIAVMTHNGCAGCHTIPGVPGAQGTVGPKLDGSLSKRRYIAGTIPNSPENMVRWLQVAREINEKTAMPSTGITDQEARDVAAYLYALR